MVDLLNMVAILMSAKLATLGLLKIKVFWNEGSDVITFVQDVTNKVLSRDSIYIIDMVMLANYSLSMREVIMTLIF